MEYSTPIPFELQRLPAPLRCRRVPDRILPRQLLLAGRGSELHLRTVLFWNAMRRRSAWKIENYTYRECPHPDREFKYAVSLHNHSCHSVEKLAALNQVVQLAFMRPLSGILQNSFG